MPFSAAKLAQYRNGMRKRIEALRLKTEDSLDFAIDHMMQERIDSYFLIEQGLEDIGRSLKLIEEELAHICDLSGALRLEARLEFIEERWEELDSEARERPRRRRRRISLADFLKAAGGGGDSSARRGEITNATEAFAALGLEYGSSLAAVTAAFRERAKKLHPDARKGDRSSEPELRRIIEAYQFLKEYLGPSATDPSGTRDAQYNPME